MIRWVTALLWASIIFYLSSVSNLSSGLESDFVLRKFAHIFVYLVLTLLVFYALLGDRKISETKNKDILKISLFSFCLSLFYSVSDEYHQTFVLGRHGDPKDILIDSVGIVIAVACIWFYHFKFVTGAKNYKQDQDS